MKNAEFTTFMQKVAEADKTDCIWWAGFMFLNLTDCQVSKIYPICRSKFGESIDKIHNRVMVKLPSSICLYSK